MFRFVLGKCAEMEKCLNFLDLLVCHLKRTPLVADNLSDSNGHVLTTSNNILNSNIDLNGHVHVNVNDLVENMISLHT